MALQEFRNLLGIGAVALHADVQGLHAPGHQKGVEGAHDRAGHVLESEHTALRDEVGLAHHHACDHVAVAVQILGGAVDHHVGAQLQGTLQIGGAEGVVHDDLDLGILGVGNLSHRGNVHDLQRGVAGALQIDHLGLFRQGSLHGLQIGHVHQTDLHAEFGDPVAQKGKRAAVQGLVSHDLVAGFHAGPEGGGNGAHAGSGGQCGLAALQLRHLFLQGGHGGVTETGIDVAALLTGETGAALLHGVKLKGGGLIDGVAECARGVFYLASVDLTGGKAKLLFSVHR